MSNLIYFNEACVVYQYLVTGTIEMHIYEDISINKNYFSNFILRNLIYYIRTYIIDFIFITQNF